MQLIWMEGGVEEKKKKTADACDFGDGRIGATPD